MNKHPHFTIDWESVFNPKNKHGFGHQTTIEYVNDPRTEIIMLATYGPKKSDRQVLQTATEIQEFLYFLSEYPHPVYAHNGLFDFYLWSVKYPRIPLPRRMGCTKMMGKGLGHVKNGLKHLAPLVGLEKHDFNMDGADPDDPAFLRYALQDARICYRLADYFYDQYYHRDPFELIVMDGTLRMMCKPRFKLDKSRLANVLTAEIQKRKDLIDQGYTPALLRSATKFADALHKLGVSPPTKISPRTGKETYAFSKSDPGYMALLEHNDPAVVALVQARLEVQSSITVSRASRFADIANMVPRSLLPVPLQYAGAHTGRYSGTDKINLQNLQRGSEMRKALAAPKGYKVVKIDLSQIEARMMAWVTGDLTYLDAFVNRKDPYKVQASISFTKPFEDVTKFERFMGKTQVLGLQYYMGAFKYAIILLQGFMGAKPVTLDLPIADQFEGMGMTVPEKPPAASQITDEQWRRHYFSALGISQGWRRSHPAITAFWRDLDHYLHLVANNEPHRIKTANEDMNLTFRDHRYYIDGYHIGLNYHAMHINEEGRPQMGKVNYYGGIFAENLIQALSGKLLRFMMALLLHKHRIPWSLQVHDELVFVIKNDSKFKSKCDTIYNVFTREYKPFKGLPLGAEISVGDNYGELEELEL